MIVLCGFPLSNYYNKVKMALLEKGLPFTEEIVATGSKDEAVRAATPLGKVPFIRTPQGPLCESQVIIDWIEAAHPQPALMPADPYAAAKVRELITFIDLHLELVARELYPQAFFGGQVAQETKDRVQRTLTRHIAGFKRLARFAPYVAGDTFTLADCAAYAALPTVGLATRLVLGEDLMGDQGIDWKGYAKFIGERPSAQRIVADRQANPQPPRA